MQTTQVSYEMKLNTASLDRWPSLGRMTVVAIDVPFYGVCSVPKIISLHFINGLCMKLLTQLGLCYPGLTSLTLPTYQEYASSSL